MKAEYRPHEARVIVEKMEDYATVLGERIEAF